MTAPVQEQVTQTSEKELNFRKMEAQYQRRLEETERRREEAERQVQELMRKKEEPEEEEEQSEDPYVDHKKLDKKLKKFGQQSQQEIKSEIQKAVSQAKEEAKRELYLEQNPDMFDYLDTHVQKFAETNKSLAKSILSMPDTFERKVLVYETMKKLGIDKPMHKESSIQEKIDANQKGHFYQPTGMGTAPYQVTGGDFSDTGKKAAYDKMKELQQRVRL